MCEGPAGCKGEQPAPMRCECALSRNVCILIIYGVCLIPKSGKDQRVSESPNFSDTHNYFVPEIRDRVF